MIKSNLQSILVIVLLFGILNSKAQTSALVAIGSNGKLVYTPDNKGNIIPDFSAVGYRNSEYPIPTVGVVKTVSPVAGDNLANIQNAINEVSAYPIDSNGFRGTILFTAGTYNISDSVTISASGIVLRGEGFDGSGTNFIATKTSQYNLINFEGASGTAYNSTSSTRKAITDSYVPIGTKQITVASGHTFVVGDAVFVHRIPNDAWISLLGMNLLTSIIPQDPTTTDWIASAYDMDSERKIMAINGNVITLDAPIMDVIDPVYSTGELVKFTDGRIQKCGIENMRISSTYTSSTDESHGWEAVSFENIYNSWARNLEVYYFGYSAVHINSGASFITVDACKMQDAKSIITGSRRYSFNIDGQRSLVKNCLTKDGRHDYVTGSRTCGPNVFYNSTSTLQNNDIGPHHRWATGILFDNLTGDGRMDVQNRLDMGSGHGWSGAQIMYWNCVAARMAIQDPEGDARNWSIGCISPDITGVGDATTEPIGIIESQGTKITAIPSLFQAQLTDRLLTVATQPTVTSVCSGTDTSFTAASNVTPIPTVQWKRSINGTLWTDITANLDSGTVYSGFTTGRLVLTGTTSALNSYQYKAVFTNFNGTIDSNVAILTVVNSTVAPSASAQTLCISNSPTVASLTATGTTLQWYTASSGGIALATTTALATGTYYVSQTVNTCESTRTAVSVSVIACSNLKIILKLDDFSASAGISAATPILDYLITKKVKTAIGFIADRNDASALSVFSSYLNQTNASGEKLFEVWNHGLDHVNPEFDATTYDYQKSHFDQANQLILDGLRVQMHSFGAPYNATDATTNTVISGNSNYKVTMFSSPSADASTGILNLNNRVNMETATGVPDYAAFVTNYNANKGTYTDYMVLQGHPNQWTTDAKKTQFSQIIDFLISEGVEFVLPYGYYLSLNPTYPRPSASQTISFSALSTKAKGDADFKPVATSTSGLTVTYNSSNSAVATIVNGSIHIVGAGTAIITASQMGDATYKPANYVSQTLTVTSREFRSLASGNWNTLGTWQQSDGNGNWTTATTLPSALNNVYIQSGHTVTVNGTEVYCYDLHTNTAGVLAISGTNNVNVNGKIRAYTGLAETSITNGVYVGTNATTMVAAMITTGSTGVLKIVGATRNITNSGEWVGATTSNNVTFALDSGAIGTLQTAIKFKVITIASGTVSTANTINVGNNEANGLITINNGARLLSSRNYTAAGAQVITLTSVARCGTVTIDFGGILELTGATPVIDCATFNNNGTVVYSGGAQTLLQNGSSSTTKGIPITIYANLTVGGTGAKTLPTSTNITVSGALNFGTSGINIVTGINTLTLGTAGSITGAGTGWVVGNLIKQTASSASPSFVYPIGDATNYTPIALTFSGNTSSAGSIAASTTSGDHSQVTASGINSSKSVNRIWSLTNSGITGFTNYSAAFTYASTDNDSSTTPANYGVSKYENLTWSSLTTSGTSTATATAATGITGFGDFAIGEVALVAPTATIIPSGPTSFCSGGSGVTLSANTGTGLTYLWSPGGATTSSIIANTSGSYTVKVTSAGGETTSAPTSVTVNEKPAATITAGGATTFCVGGSVTLTASAGSSYLWSTGATTQSINVNTSISPTVTVTNAATCSATSAPTTVTVNALPTATISAGGATTFCAGASVTLIACAGSSYLWSTGATTQSISATTAGSYSVTVTNSNSCSATSAATTVWVNALPMATISAGGATTFCAGGSVTLTASAGSSYSWSTGATTQSISATESGDYTVAVTNANSCSAISAATTVTVNGSGITTPPIAQTICPSIGASATLSVVSANPSATYQWELQTKAATGTAAALWALVSGGNYTGGTSASLTITKSAVAVPKTGTLYRVKVASACGTVTSDAVVITDQALIAAPAISSSEVKVICKYIGTDNLVTFTATPVVGTTPASYSWKLPAGAKAEDGSDTATTLIPTLKVNFHDVNFTNLGTTKIGIGSLTVDSNNILGCPSGKPKALVLTTVAATVPKAVVLSYNGAVLKAVGNFVADATKRLTLTVTDVSGTADHYDFTLPEGVRNVVGASSVSDSKTFYTGTEKVITFDLGEVVKNNANLAFAVTAVAGCGSSVAKTLEVTRAEAGTPKGLVLTDAMATTEPLAAAVAPIVVKALSSYTGSLKTRTLILTATPEIKVGLQATSYKWVLPTGATTTADHFQILNPTTGLLENVPSTYTSTLPTINITLGDLTTNETSFVFKVYGVNGNGTSLLSKDLTLVSKAPVAPAAIYAGTNTSATGIKYIAYNNACSTGTISVPAVMGVNNNLELIGAVNGVTLTHTADSNQATIDVSSATGSVLAKTFITIRATASTATGTVFKDYVVKFLAACSGGRMVSDVPVAADEFNVIAYPNPSSDVFKLEVQSSSKGATGVHVYDMAGRLIEQRQVNSNSVEVGRNYASGIYNIIVNQGTKVKTLRVIKR